MNKQAFLSVLRNRLSGLPKEDIERSVDFYSEIIDDRIEDGLSEDEAVKAIGSIDEIVSQILKETSLPKLVKSKVKPKRALRVGEIILLILGAPMWLPLVISIISIVFSAYIVLWSVILVLYSIDLSFAATAVACILGTFAYIPSGNIAQCFFIIGIGLACFGIAILLFFIFNQITKGVLILSKKIVLGIKGCFIGKGDAQ